MCGIVGYIGHEQAQPILLEGLSRLEYRGYDSAGIAVMDGGRISLMKAKGRLANLEERLSGAPLHGSIGIGHTRWATHGEPSDLNAHPHTDMKGDIAIVHNGIIENHESLRASLIQQGCAFVSQTDTEVVAHLLNQLWDGSMLSTLRRAMAMLEGSYALCVISAREPGVLYCTRKDSPLVVGLSDGAQYVASDIPALIAHTREVELLDDKEIAVLTAESATVYDAYGHARDLHPIHVDWDVEAAEKGGYAHFMLKEIMEQPEAIRKAAFPRIRDNRILFEDLKLDEEYIRNISKLYIVACGSSYHVGVVGKYNLERMLRKPVEVCLASEFRYCDPLVDDRTLVIVISQSGETLDTMAALREAKALGAHILSIVNVVGSSIARESDDVIYTWAGPEIAVATTKAYSTQLVLLNMLGICFGDILGNVSKAEYAKMIDALLRLPGQMEQMLEDIEDIKHFASKYFNHNSAFFIGRNLDYAMGLEGSLKLKEISYIHSEAYASGELKHGTISLIEDGTLVIALGTYAPLFDKAMSNVVEVQARGADVLAVTTESHVAEMKKTVENVIAVPESHTIFQPSLGVVPLQLFAYYVALLRGCDIDKPRNLAKSVTVE